LAANAKRIRELFRELEAERDRWQEAHSNIVDATRGSFDAAEVREMLFKAAGNSSGKADAILREHGWETDDGNVD
jgi:hypothetical protein